jgi:hypothetical protein
MVDISIGSIVAQLKIDASGMIQGMQAAQQQKQRRVRALLDAAPQPRLVERN